MKPGVKFAGRNEESFYIGYNFLEIIYTHTRCPNIEILMGTFFGSHGICSDSSYITEEERFRNMWNTVL